MYAYGIKCLPNIAITTSSVHSVLDNLAMHGLQYLFRLNLIFIQTRELMRNVNISRGLVLLFMKTSIEGHNVCVAASALTFVDHSDIAAD